jgi:hypothetical protein
MNSNLSLTDALWQSTPRLFQELVFPAQFPRFALQLAKPGPLTHRQCWFLAGVLTPVGINPVGQSARVQPDLLGHLSDRT